jgi:hypothetical protein
MNQPYKYPPDTSWLPTGPRARGWQWGAGSIALSLAPFVVLPIVMRTVGFNDEFRLVALAVSIWFIGALVGMRGISGPGAARTMAWIGVLMNILIPLIGWMLAPLIVGLLMSWSMGSG